MTQSERATTRISSGLADFIKSLSENENAATRALILIGADQLGLDPTQVADDLRVTLGARLPPVVYAKLLALWNRVDHGGLATGSRPEVARDGSHAATHPIRPAIPGAGANGGEARAAEVVRMPGEVPAPRDQSRPRDPFDSLGFDFDAPAE